MANINTKENRYWVEYRNGAESKVLGLVLGIKAALEVAKTFELLDSKYVGKIKIVKSFNEVTE